MYQSSDRVVPYKNTPDLSPEIEDSTILYKN
jgi:hypothetical protein